MSLKVFASKTMERALCNVVVRSALVTLCLACAGCSMCCAHRSAATSVTAFPDYTNYFQLTNLAGFRVYLTEGVARSAIRPAAIRPPILLLHELPGLTPQCLSLATNIAQQGFTVYAPVLFGQPDNSSSTWRNFRNSVRLLFSPQWRVMGDTTPPIAKRLQPLVDSLAGPDGKPVGIVGMCLTGTLPLVFATNPAVRCLVVSQPAVPFAPWTASRRRALGLSAPDLEAAELAVTNRHVKITAFRFENDTLSTAERMTNMASRFGANFHCSTITRSEYEAHAPTACHSVLCEEYDNNPGTPTRRRFDEMIAAFHENLKPTP